MTVFLKDMCYNKKEHEEAERESAIDNFLKLSKKDRKRTIKYIEGLLAGQLKGESR